MFIPKSRGYTVIPPHIYFQYDLPCWFVGLKKVGFARYGMQRDSATGMSYPLKQTSKPRYPF